MWKATTYENDGRFKSRKSKKAERAKRPAVFAQPVDLKHVLWESITRWIEVRTTALLDGVEDEILVGFITESLTAADQPADAYQLADDLEGFLGDKAEGFVEELWRHLVDASSNPAGLPSAFMSKPKTAAVGGRDDRERERERERDDGRKRRKNRWEDDGRSRGRDGERRTSVEVKDEPVDRPRPGDRDRRKSTATRDTGVTATTYEPTSPDDSGSTYRATDESDSGDSESPAKARRRGRKEEEEEDPTDT